MTAPAVAVHPVCTRCAIHAESVFRIDGMCCGEEAKILQRRLTPLSGIEDVAPDIVGQRLHVKYDAAVVSTNVIVEAVAETGMRAWLEHEQPIAPPASRSRGLLVLASGVALAVGLVALDGRRCADLENFSVPVGCPHRRCLSGAAGAGVDSRP